MRTSGGVALAASLMAVAALGGPAHAADKIKIGFFSTLEGPYTALGEDGQRGFDLAVTQHHNKAGGKDLEIIRGVFGCLLLIGRCGPPTSSWSKIRSIF